MGRKLNARFVETIKTPGIYSDGPNAFGLSLRVRSGARGISKTWVQRIRIDGRPTYLGLGRVPVVTLREARAAALENYRAVNRGGDPRRKRKAAAAPTFAEAAETVIALHSKAWKHRETMTASWRQTFRDYVLPKLGDMTVDRIEAADVLAVLKPIWSTKPATAKVVRHRVRAVLRWAVAGGYRTSDPTDTATAALPKANGRTKHHKALPHDRIRDVLAKVRAADSRDPALRLCYTFAALTASRPSEARGARWSEVDMDAALWTIPAERMKGGREHVVPLSREALAVLLEAWPLRNDTGLCFPSSTTGKRFNPATLRLLARDLAQCPPHSLRNAFAGWCAENGVDRETREAALSHVVRGVSQAYMRSDLLERRREVMERWGRYAAGGDGTLMERD